MRPLGFAHDVLRLQVAVNDADGVRRFEGLADLLDDADSIVGWQLLSLMDEGAKVVAFDELHRDELHAVGITEVVDADDIAVRDLRGEDQLLLEALDYGGVAGEFAADGLEGDDAVQFEVTGLVDGSHATLAEKGEDFIALAEDVSGLKDGLAAEDRVADGAAGREGGRSLAGGWRRSHIRRCVAGELRFRRRAFPFKRRAQTAVPPRREVVVRGDSSSMVVDDFRAPTAK